VALFATNLDGTDYAIFAGDEGARLKRMPCVTANRLAVFVESEEPTRDGAGRLAGVSLRRNLHSYRELTHPPDGLYHSPSPLPNGELLVSRRPRDGSGTHAVYRFDPASGRAALIYDDPQRHDIQARSLSPRPEPDGRSSVVNKQDPTGILYGLNVYTTDLEQPDWLPPGSVKRLRVLEGLPERKPPASGLPPRPRSRVLGEIDVEQDGSFNIRVPANLPIRLQLLDEDGLALRTCEWIWVRNKESRGCIGCHEDGELTPENRMVEAITKPSIPLTPPPESRRTVDFGRDVVPIVSAKCTRPISPARRARARSCGICSAATPRAHGTGPRRAPRAERFRLNVRRRSPKRRRGPSSNGSISEHTDGALVDEVAARSRVFDLADGSGRRSRAPDLHGRYQPGRHRIQA
jgi:hypothetical protein